MEDSVELRHLRYFVAVGEEEHFGRAAARLHVVQPALTRQVQQLEAELGCALFARLKRGVRLTEAGKVFLAEARRLLADLDQSVDRTRLVAQGQVGRLRVGFADTATYSGVLPTLLRDFRARWPDVRLELCVLALPHAHPLVTRKRVRLSDLTREPFVWFPRAVAPLLYDRVLATCHAAGVTVQIEQEVNNATRLLSLVAG